VTAFDILLALMLSTCSTKEPVVIAEQTVGCAPVLWDKWLKCPSEKNQVWSQLLYLCEA